MACDGKEMKSKMVNEWQEQNYAAETKADCAELHPKDSNRVG